MFLPATLYVLLGLWSAQAAAAPVADPPYLAEGRRVERLFDGYRNGLAEFYASLRGALETHAPHLLPRAPEAPPRTAVYGYQLLPPIVDSPPPGAAASIGAFSYSWPITLGYIENEGVKLNRARTQLETALGSAGQSGGQDLEARLATLTADYRTLVANQRTVDQYVQYNRFWQRQIAVNRPRFDQLTEVYDRIGAGELEAASAVRTLLGSPQAPAFIEIVRAQAGQVLLRVPVYTDIQDDAYLERAKAAIEAMWQASENGVSYAAAVEFTKVAPADLYAREPVPQTGDRFEIPAHAARFPADGGVLTTGAESTHAIIGRYVALGPGEIFTRTLAHEFGHLLGFPDGYLRGYRDLGENGFEILELTAVFDDIMTAPREGRVQAEHFRLIIEALESRR